MSMDGVVPPAGGPTRRPAGGPADDPGRAVPTGPVPPPAAGRNPAGQARIISARSGAAADLSGGPASGDQDQHASDGALSAGSGAEGAGSEPAMSDLCDPDLLRDALRSRVAPIGAGGPPQGGLTRIRRKARVRQRNRAVLVSSAGVLIIAVAVTVATGDRFDIVPTLTGTSGNGGGAVAGGQTGGSAADRSAAAAANGGHVVWPTADTGKTGPAIGPVPPVTATPSAAAATKVPLCTASSVSVNTTLGPTIDGVVYGYVGAVAKSTCVVVGPPVLAVTNQAGTAAGSVLILKEDTKVAPALPSVSTWGETMVLAPGASYEFQFAWATAQCPRPSGSAPSSTSTASAATTTYALGYAVTGTTPTSQVTLTAACGADVFVTDIYRPGAYPLPTAVTQSPVPTDSASPVSSTPAVPSTPPTTNSPPPTSPTTSGPSSPPPSGSASGGVGTGGAGTSPTG
jgi:hypothetical protein